jgi:glycosyltransferase involved in cell wall biosynthesis
VWRKKVVYFFDDPIYLDCPDHIRFVIEKADVVITVAGKLAEYALQYNPRVVMFEDAVSLDRYPLKSSTVSRGDEKLVIGWVGNSVVGLRYLKQLREPLLQLFDKYKNLTFRVISGRDFQFSGLGVPVDNIRWRLDHEDSVTFDIGVAPLLESEYDKNKTSFKILQYWAHGIPVVCAQTADNFLEDGVNCLIVKKPADWIATLSLLIEHADLRKRMGETGRRLIEKRFALEVKGPQLASLLRTIVNDPAGVEYYREAS